MLKVAKLGGTWTEAVPTTERVFASQQEYEYVAKIKNKERGSVCFLWAIEKIINIILVYICTGF